jgi:hypothetical protein
VVIPTFAPTLEGCLVVPRILCTVDDILVAASKLARVDAVTDVVAVFGILDRSIDLHNHSSKYITPGNSFIARSSYMRRGKWRMKDVISGTPIFTSIINSVETVMTRLLARVYGNPLRSLVDDPDVPVNREAGKEELNRVWVSKCLVSLYISKSATSSRQLS